MAKFPSIDKVIDLVIITEFDAPAVRQINALFVSRDGTRYVAYIRDWSDIPPKVRWQKVEGDGSRWIFPIRTFGVRPILTEDGCLFVEPTGEESKATYSDGEPRRWQGRPGRAVELNRHVRAAVAAYVRALPKEVA